VREPFDGPLEPEGDYDQLRLDGLDLHGQDARRARFIECALTGCALDDVRLDGADLVDTEVTGSHAGTLTAPDSRWREVLVGDCRLGALVAHGATLTRVTVRGAKIDYLNLRGARLEDVTLVGCTVGDLDLNGAQARRLVLEDCRVARLDLQGATLVEADLRGADLRRIDGVAGLAGATISEEQLVSLAQLLATHLGVTVA